MTFTFAGASGVVGPSLINALTPQVRPAHGAMG